MADANKMITRAECNAIAPGAFSGELNRCPTKAEIVATGKFNISGSYANNQLVKYSDLSAKPTKPTKPTIYLSPGSEETKPNNCTVYASGEVLDDIGVYIDVYDDMNSQIIGNGVIHITAGQTVGTGPVYPMNSWDKPMCISMVNGISTPPAELTNAKYSWPK